MKSVEVDGVEYVPVSKKAEKLDGMEYVIVRTYSAGVFAGYLKERDGKEGVMLQSRRLYSWSGAATLSQLANEGVSNPDDCKFPAAINGEHTLTEIIEIISCTAEAKKSINKVTIWSE